MHDTNPPSSAPARPILDGRNCAVLSSSMTPPSFCLYSSMFCRICSTFSLKDACNSLTTSYDTMQSNMLFVIGRTFVVSQPALSKWKPPSSMCSLMCTFGRSSIFVCWERCSAASHVPRSLSVSGKMECCTQHRESIPEVGGAFISTKCECKILIGSCLGYI
jgi:hypothetical protein